MVFLGYLRPEAAQRLATYQYKAGSYTALDVKVLGPFWEFVAGFVPKSVSPNMVTLTGLTANVLATCVLLAHTFVLQGDPRTKFAVHCVAAASLFFYQTMDGVDGKHARRTGQSTPLGAFFDHGCDGIAMFVNAIVMELITVTEFSDGLSPYHYMQFVCYLLVLYSFFVSQWGHYHTGVLPTAGCSEAQLLSIVLIASCGHEAFRAFWFENKPLCVVPGFLQGVFPRNGDAMQFVGTIICLGVMLSVIRAAVSTKLARANGAGHAAACVDMAMGTVPCLLHCAASVALFVTDRLLFLDNRFLILMVLGLCMTDLSLRMIISGLVNQPFQLLHPTAAPLLAYAALLAAAGRAGAGEAGGPTLLGVVGGQGVISHRSCMMAIAAFEAVCLLLMFADTIQQFCQTLKIPFLAPVVRPAAKKGE